MPDAKTILLIVAFVANIVQFLVITSLNAELDAVRRTKDFWLEMFLRASMKLYESRNEVDE